LYIWPPADHEVAFTDETTALGRSADSGDRLIERVKGGAQAGAAVAFVRARNGTFYGFQHGLPTRVRPSIAGPYGVCRSFGGIPPRRRTVRRSLRQCAAFQLSRPSTRPVGAHRRTSIDVRPEKSPTTFSSNADDPGGGGPAPSAGCPPH